MGTLSTTQKDDLSAQGPSDRTEPSLAIVLEGERLLAGGMRVSLEGVKEVRFARGESRTWKNEGGSATLEVPDPRMSGRHARLVRELSGWVLEDLGSTNGTYLNGEPLRGPQPLHVGDSIRIGDSEFTFERA